MSVNVVSKIKQFNAALFPILDDIDLKGSFRVLDLISDWDDYVTGGAKESFGRIGAWFHVLQDGKVYELNFTKDGFDVVSGFGSAFTPGNDQVFLIGDEVDFTISPIAAVDGSIGWAQDTETMFVRINLTWQQAPKVRLYADEATRLADSTVSARTIGIETNTGLSYYFDNTVSPNAWRAMAVPEVDGGTYV